MRVDPPPAVVVGQGAGQDEQGGEDRQVAADDVRLALEDADHGGRQVLADPRQGDVDDGPVEEDRAGPDDRRDEGPALAWASCVPAPRIAVADRLSRHARTRGARRRRRVPPRDGRLRRRPARLDRARPTARRDPADGVVPRRRGRLPALGGDGRRPLRRASARRSSRCSSATARRPTIRRRPGDRRGRPHLPVRRQARRTCWARSAGRAVGRALVDGPRPRRGAGRLLGRGDGPGRVTRSTSGSGSCPWPLRWRDGLGFAPGVSVVPHYDAWPEPFSALIALQAPRGSVVLGHRRGDGRRRARRVVAGPRPVAGHGLARPPSRALPRRRGVPALAGRPSLRGSLLADARTPEFANFGQADVTGDWHPIPVDSTPDFGHTERGESGRSGHRATGHDHRVASVTPKCAGVAGCRPWHRTGASGDVPASSAAVTSHVTISGWADQGRAFPAQS